MYTLLYFHINIQNKCILIDWFKLGGIQLSTGKIWYNKLGLQIFLYNRTSVIPNKLILIRNRCTQYIPGRFHDIFRTNDTRPVLIISFFLFLFFFVLSKLFESFHTASGHTCRNRYTNSKICSYPEPHVNEVTAYDTYIWYKCTIWYYCTILIFCGIFHIFR